MSALSCFQGDAGLRDQVLARLQAPGLPEYLSPGPVVFGAEESSLAGLMVQASDAAAFPEALGLPRWLAFALDEVAGGCPREATLPRLSASIMGWPLGADLGPLAARVVVAVIADAQHTLGRSDAELDGVQALADQACQLLRGEAVPSEVPAGDPWRSLRRTALRLTDAQTSERARLLGRCVEAAAWADMATADTTVAEVLRAWRMLQFSLVNEALGWTDAVERRMEALHVALEQELATREDASPELFQQLFKQRHPEEADLLGRYYKGQHEQAEALAMRAQVLLFDALASH